MAAPGGVPQVGNRRCRTCTSGEGVRVPLLGRHLVSRCLSCLLLSLPLVSGPVSVPLRSFCTAVRGA
eukprot:1267049-Prorocentrum_lima.AAC.1